MTNTTKTRRITKKDYYAAIIKGIEAGAISVAGIDPDITDDMMLNFAENERELLAKKNSAERKPTKVQQENEAIKSKILAVMDTTPATVSEIMKRDEVLAALSNQKVSALMTQLVNDDMVVKTEEKRKSYFALA